MIKLKRNFKLKILSLFALAVACVGLFACNSKTYAYTMDSSGNLVSDNCADYASISSNAFLDLGSGRFVLNWNGAVQTVSIPTSLSSNTTSGSYTLSCTLEEGVGYAFYQWFFMYSDNTSERITSNQSLTVGQRYEFISNSSKILIGLQVVCNNNSTYDDLMLNKGNIALDYEIYGSTYYATKNDSMISIFSAKSLKYAYLTYSQNNVINYDGIVLDGNIGYTTNNGSSFPDYSSFVVDNSIDIDTSYGIFYNTNYTIGNYITDYGAGGIDIDTELLLTYVFISPVDINYYIDNSYFESFTLYDSNDRLIDSYSNSNDWNVIASNVSKFVVKTNNSSDVFLDKFYIGTNPYTYGYNDGYISGYNYGLIVGTQNGFQNGYDSGYYEGENYADTHVNTNSVSYQAGVASAPGFTAGYSAGYAKGVTESSHITDTTTQGKELIWTVASTPWESFKNIWNVNIFGLNIANIITGIVTALLVIYLIKKVWK